jgi:NAD(P)-dependent dehydrogenase (short-subunit alcohol dehydrogenase family)
MDLHLTGKTAIVTGASKGIGRAVARLLAEEGCQLHIASRTEADLAALAEEIRGKHQVNVTIHPMDLGKSGQPEALAEAAGDVDILVNNAGAIPGGSLDRVDEETWREAWNLKVFGYVNLTRAVYARMKAAGGGVIVNVIGTAGERQDYNYIAGSAGNASLMAFTRGLGSDSARDNIRVVACNPGMTETERLVTLLKTSAKNKGLDPENWREMTSHLPFGRPGTADEVADLVAFLASDRASYISGTVVTIDAGNSSRGGLF